MDGAIFHFLCSYFIFLFNSILTSDTISITQQVGKLFIHIPKKERSAFIHVQNYKVSFDGWKIVTLFCQQRSSVVEGGDREIIREMALFRKIARRYKDVPQIPPLSQRLVLDRLPECQACKSSDVTMQLSISPLMERGYQQFCHIHAWPRPGMHGSKSAAILLRKDFGQKHVRNSYKELINPKCV